MFGLMTNIPRHSKSGSPLKPLGQLQTATWLAGKHMAPLPQAPEAKQGLEHLPRIQALSDGQLTDARHPPKNVNYI